MPEGTFYYFNNMSISCFLFCFYSVPVDVEVTAVFYVLECSSMQYIIDKISFNVACWFSLICTLP